MGKGEKNIFKANAGDGDPAPSPPVRTHTWQESTPPCSVPAQSMLLSRTEPYTCGALHRASEMRKTRAFNSWLLYRSARGGEGEVREGVMN